MGPNWDQGWFTAWIERLRTAEMHVEYIHKTQAQHAEWMEDQDRRIDAQDRRISELEINERVKGGVLRAICSAIGSPAVGRVAVGALLAAVAGAKWLGVQLL